MKLFFLPLLFGFILGTIFVKLDILKLTYFKKSIINYILTLLLKMLVVSILALIIYYIFFE